MNNEVRADHYEKTVYEPIKVIRAWNLNFDLGNVLKYIARRNSKGTPLLDLKKARRYLDFEIEELEKAEKAVTRVLTGTSHTVVINNIKKEIIQ